MMIRIISKLAFVAVALVWATAGHATLIGDTVNIAHYYPNADTVCDGCIGPFDVVVAADDSDAVTLGVGNQSYTVDMGAEGFSVLFLNDQGWLDNVAFNGIIISGLDWVGSGGGYISGIVINDKPLDYADSDITFTDHSVSILLGVSGATNGVNNNQFFSDERFDISLLTVHVPEPSTIALFGLGLAGLGFVRRKKV